MIEPFELARLLDRYGGMLRQLAASWCDAADDCVQEALIRLAAQAPTPEDPVAWLARVVRNEARSRERAAVRRRAHERVAAELRLRHTEGADLAADQISPREAAEALDCLAIEDLEIVVLRIWGGLGFEQVAAIVGRSRSAVHRHYMAALAQLRSQLETAGPSPPEEPPEKRRETNDPPTDKRPCANKTNG